MSINLEPQGRISIPLVKLHDMLAGSLEFQARINASSEEEAAERIHLISVPFSGVDENDFNTHLPFGIVGWEDFNATRVAYQHFNTTGELGLTIYHAAPSPSKDSTVDFTNYLGRIVGNFEEATDNAEDNLMINNVNLAGLLYPPDHWENTWVGASFIFSYGADEA